MKLSVVSSIVLSMTALVLGIPIPKRDVSTIPGAAYFLTNDPNLGNYIVAAGIQADGSLTYQDAYFAGGVGAHANSTGVNPLFSQGAIQISTESHLLATLNAGSSTVAIFSINPENPTMLTMLGHPLPSGGDLPVSLAMNKAGTRVCALNGGKVNGISCFSVDNELGLVSKPGGIRFLNLNHTVSAPSLPGSVGQVIFNEDETQLIASVKGSKSAPGFLAIWDIELDGSLSEAFTSVEVPSGGAMPSSITIIANETALLATDPTTGFEIFDLSGSSTNSTSYAFCVPGQVATGWSSYSNKTGNYYLSDPGASTITEVHVDENLNATLVKQYPPANMSTPLDTTIATIGEHDFLFALSPNASAIQVMQLNSAGNASTVGSFNFTQTFQSVNFTIDPSNLVGMAVFSLPTATQ